jgi:hypothetical protein
VIEGFFSGVSADEVLRDLSIVDLKQLWDKIVHQSVIREDLIDQLDTGLNDIEKDRAQLVRH